MPYLTRFTAIALLGWAGAGLWVSELAHLMWLFNASLAVAGLAGVIIVIESWRHGARRRRISRRLHGRLDAKTIERVARAARLIKERKPK
jgi:hypothetical protein